MFGSKDMVVRPMPSSKSAADLGEESRAAELLRSKYDCFRELLAFNTECLERMAELQRDLRYVPPRTSALGDFQAPIFQLVRHVVQKLETLSGVRQDVLTAALDAQQTEIERYTAALEQPRAARISAWLSEIHVESEAEAGSKAAYLGEIRNRVGLPVPDGFVITTEAYWQFCGMPLWKRIRDTTDGLNPDDLATVRNAAALLAAAVAALPLPRSVEEAITRRSHALLKNGGTLAIRSSAAGEGRTRSFAGQFLSLLNVREGDAVSGYRRVVAGRFSDRALSYRLSGCQVEAGSPLAVLFLSAIPARASGVLYTRDPGDLKSNTLWVTSARGLGGDIVSGQRPADLFLISRSLPHSVLNRSTVRQEDQIVANEGGGIARVPLPRSANDEPGIEERHLRTLAQWGVEIEDHFGAPQDVEWVLGHDDRMWIVQSRPLVRAGQTQAPSHSKSDRDPPVAAGRSVYPGRTSGSAYLVSSGRSLEDAPQGSIVFVPQPSPEIVRIFPRIAGLVAEGGSLASHAATLLREFRIPAVFETPGVFDLLSNGASVSLDAARGSVYSGVLWPASGAGCHTPQDLHERAIDPVSRRLLALHLIDPGAHNFLPSGCVSAHDVLRYCHEKAIAAMFEINDARLEQHARHSKRLRTTLPLNVRVFDLGGGIAAGDAASQNVDASQIASRPFQAFWKGISHPAVSWGREMPARVGDLASVLATVLEPRSVDVRALGERSYLLVAAEHMNLNSRLAYHYSLVDAAVTGTPASNYISFRFEGGGASPERRSLRARFIATCLGRHGFEVDRQRDLVNAWFLNATAEDTSSRLDILGRLLACSSQLDMYLRSEETMNWYVQQFLAGNYTFRDEPAGPPSCERITV